MGLEIPDEVKWLSWIVGSDWPEGDETAMRRLADAWHQAATEVNELIPDPQRSASNVLSSVEDTAADNFERYWNTFVTTDPQYLPKLAELCENLAKQVEQGALDIEYAKYMFIALLIITAIEIAILIANMIETFGVSAAGIPAVEARAQVISRTIFQKLLIAIARGAAMGVLQGAGLDVLIQTIQIAKGDRDGLDLKKTAMAGVDGAIGGAISGGVGHGTAHVPGLSGADNPLSGMVKGAVREGLSEGISVSSPVGAGGTASHDGGSHPYSGGGGSYDGGGTGSHGSSAGTRLADAGTGTSTAPRVSDGPSAAAPPTGGGTANTAPSGGAGSGADLPAMGEGGDRGGDPGRGGISAAGAMPPGTMGGLAAVSSTASGASAPSGTTSSGSVSGGVDSRPPVGASSLVGSSVSGLPPGGSPAARPLAGQGETGGTSPRGQLPGGQPSGQATGVRTPGSTAEGTPRTTDLSGNRVPKTLGGEAAPVSLHPSFESTPAAHPEGSTSEPQPSAEPSGVPMSAQESGGLGPDGPGSSPTAGESSIPDAAPRIPGISSADAGSVTPQSEPRGVEPRPGDPATGSEPRPRTDGPAEGPGAAHGLPDAAFNSALRGLAGEYPSTFQQLQNLGSVDMHATFGPDLEGAMAATNAPPDGGMYFDESYFNDTDAARVDAADDEASGHLAPGTGSIEGTVYHEFAHLFGEQMVNDPAALADLNRAVSDALGVPYDATQPHDGPAADAIRDALSDYGGEDPHEMIAEAFAEYKLSDNPRPLAQAIGGVIDQHFGSGAGHDGTTQRDTGYGDATHESASPADDEQPRPRRSDPDTDSEPRRHGSTDDGGTDRNARRAGDTDETARRRAVLPDDYYLRDGEAVRNSKADGLPELKWNEESGQWELKRFDLGTPEPEVPGGEENLSLSDADDAGVPDGGGHPAGQESIPHNLPEHLHDVYRVSEQTPVGRSLYEPGDQGMRDLARRVQADPSQYVLDGHGTPDGMRVGDRNLDARDIADIIRNDPNWNGREVLLLSCDTGRDSGAFAGDLARELGVPVVAPDGLAWSDSQGLVFSSSGQHGLDGGRGPTWPPDDGWTTFHPEGTTTAAGEHGFPPGHPDTSAEPRPDDAVARGGEAPPGRADETEQSRVKLNPLR